MFVGKHVFCNFGGKHIFLRFDEKHDFVILTGKCVFPVLVEIHDLWFCFFFVIWFCGFGVKRVFAISILAENMILRFWWKNMILRFWWENIFFIFYSWFWFLFFLNFKTLNFWLNLVLAHLDYQPFGSYHIKTILIWTKLGHGHRPNCHPYLQTLLLSHLDLEK